MYVCMCPPTHQHVYLKLRALVDRGCVFVGHGLRKDFRTLNMIVPEQQVGLEWQ